METIAQTALPLFGLIVLGYVLVGRGLLGETTVSGLNAFVFYVSLPTLLFDKIRTAPFEDLVDPRFVLAYYGPTLFLLALVALVSRWRYGTSTGNALVQGIGTTWANSGYMGIPLLLTLGGAELALPAILVLTFDILITTPISISVLETARGQAKGWVRSARLVLRNLAYNPLILGVILGLIVGQSGVTPPGPLQELINLLAGATVPCALFALGGSLVGVPVSSARREVALLSTLKLLAHPMLVAFSVWVVVPLDPVVALGTVIVASLPTGASVFVLAERYQTHVQRASTVVLVTHAASLITVPLLLYFLLPNS